MRGKHKFALTGLAAMAATAGTVWAVTAMAPLSASAAADVDESASLVEDFQYPNADRVLAESNNRVRVISGDGHILWADCATAPATGIGRIDVWTSGEVDPVCFDVTGPSGLLNLEVAAVYEIDARRADDAGVEAATATVTTDDGEVTPVELSLDRSTQVGMGADPSADLTTLVQLVVQP